MIADAPPIACQKLTRYYGKHVGIVDLDLRVEAGQVVGFLGPNGAGKTTTIRILMGLLRRTSGDATLFGVAVDNPESRRRVGFAPADPVFYPNLTGTQNLDLFAELQGNGAAPDRAWAAELLDLDPADLDRPVSEYSSGMRQKLVLVQAVQHRPDLVLLDEPANRLDPIAHHRFEELVSEVARSGRTVFLSSHTLPDVEAVCDAVAMVRDGRLFMTADVADLSAAALRVVMLRYSQVPTRFPEALLDLEIDGNEVRARLEGRRVDVLRELLTDPALEDILVEPAPLEETFLHLYEGES